MKKIIALLLTVMLLIGVIQPNGKNSLDAAATMCSDQRNTMVNIKQLKR